MSSGKTWLLEGQNIQAPIRSEPRLFVTYEHLQKTLSANFKNDLCTGHVKEPDLEGSFEKGSFVSASLSLGHPISPKLAESDVN